MLTLEQWGAIVPGLSPYFVLTCFMVLYWNCCVLLILSDLWSTEETTISKETSPGCDSSFLIGDFVGSQLTALKFGFPNC